MVFNFNLDAAARRIGLKPKITQSVCPTCQGHKNYWCSCETYYCTRCDKQGLVEVPETRTYSGGNGLPIKSKKDPRFIPAEQSPSF